MIAVGQREEAVQARQDRRGYAAAVRSRITRLLMVKVGGARELHGPFASKLRFTRH